MKSSKVEDEAASSATQGAAPTQGRSPGLGAISPVHADKASAAGFWRWPRPSLILALGLVAGFSAGNSAPWIGGLGCASSQEAASFRIVPEAWRIIRRHYVDRAAVSSPNLAHGAVAGMVRALGDIGHSTFLTRAMVTQLKQAERGRLEGIGVEIQMKAGKVTVVTALDDSPAFRAGIRPGDVLVKINHEPIETLPLPEVAARVRGAPGTAVELTLLDPKTGREKELSVTRATVRIHSVTWQRLAETGMAYLRLARFDEETTKEIKEALTQIDRNRATGIVLDLRSNPGGILDAAVEVASQFLSGGNVLLVKNSDGSVRPIPALHGGKAEKIPLVVLVNRGSASAAEIVAGALKDAARAPLVGETTFGTGTVLQEFDLSDGSALLLAIQEWLTPSGHSFWHEGIVPDIVISLPAETNMVTPDQLQSMTMAELNNCQDTQLRRALELLGENVKTRR